MAIRSTSRKKSLEAGDGCPSECERSSHNNNGDTNWLPDGWTVEFKTRKSANSKAKRYKCYVDSQGHKCYSKPQVFDYLKKISRKEAPEMNTAIKRQRTMTVPVSSSDTMVKNEEHKKTRNCCGEFPPEYKRWRMAREKARWSKNNRELRVENLHPSTSELELKQIFEAFGPVKRVRLPRDPEIGHCYGFAYIEFARLKDSKAAVQSLNGKKEIAGQTIKVCSLTAYDMAQNSIYWKSKSTNAVTRTDDTNGSKSSSDATL